MDKDPAVRLADCLSKAESGDSDALIEAACQVFLRPTAATAADQTCRQKVLGLLIQAAMLDNAQILTVLGAVYEIGHGISNDYAKAAHYYQTAARRGNPNAMYNLACLYRNDKGVAVDYKKAFQLYSKAALLQNPPAFIGVGEMLMDGDYGQKDEALGFACYAYAYHLLKNDTAAEYYPIACLSLGQGFLYGQGIDADVNKAVTFLSYAKQGFDTGIRSGLYAADDRRYRQTCCLLNKALSLCCQPPLADGPALVKENSDD